MPRCHARTRLSHNHVKVPELQGSLLDRLESDFSSSLAAQQAAARVRQIKVVQRDGTASLVDDPLHAARLASRGGPFASSPLRCGVAQSVLAFGEMGVLDSEGAVRLVQFVVQRGLNDPVKVCAGRDDDDDQGVNPPPVAIRSARAKTTLASSRASCGVARTRAHARRLHAPSGRRRRASRSVSHPGRRSLACVFAARPCARLPAGPAWRS
jgi:hypothetical protein